MDTTGRQNHCNLSSPQKVNSAPSLPYELPSTQDIPQEGWEGNIKGSMPRRQAKKGMWPGSSHILSAHQLCEQMPYLTYLLSTQECFLPTLWLQPEMPVCQCLLVSHNYRIVKLTSVVPGPPANPMSTSAHCSTKGNSTACSPSTHKALHPILQYCNENNKKSLREG